MITALRYGAKWLANQQLTSLLPHHVHLHACATPYQIEYSQQKHTRTYHKPHANHLVIHGEDPIIQQKNLLHWLGKEAHKWLIPLTNTLSQELNLYPQAIHIRHQKTRWGSCSNRGRINLNKLLMLVEPDLVRYTICHELCHLKHMNHGQAFWALLEQHCYQAKKIDRIMRQHYHTLPAWSQKGLSTRRRRPFFALS
jgi:predicted metal-dependent hydrolase